MSKLSKQTAIDIALAHREIETARELLEKIEKELKFGNSPDIRDVFGRPQSGLELGVPSGKNSHRMFNVPWSICKPVIETHIAHQEAIIDVLSSKALQELQGGEPVAEGSEGPAMDREAEASK